MRDGSPLEDNVRINRQATPLQDLSAALTRSEAAFKMFRDFSVCGLRELVGNSLQGLTNSRRLTAMDLYDRPLREVEQLLRQQNIEVETRTASKACSPQNLRNTAWTIEPGSNITLLIYGDRVVGIQKGDQRFPNLDNPNQ
ncbi:MAG: hypothetical protein KME16_00320 [Scytolyngbya sp. HA4215-MV1]|jgi:hypothetical protein|nr:hypothetical protein [Scytolyngbya sp. HA4215-MV1]